MSEKPIQHSDGQQQHRQHSTSQEAGRAAQDGSQHRQDKGLQGGCRLDGLLRSPRQGRPPADSRAGIRKPVSGEEVFLRHPLTLPEEAKEPRGSWDTDIRVCSAKWAPFPSTAFDGEGEASWRVQAVHVQRTGPL